MACLLDLGIGEDSCWGGTNGLPGLDPLVRRLSLEVGLEEERDKVSWYDCTSAASRIRSWLKSEG